MARPEWMAENPYTVTAPFINEENYELREDVQIASVIFDEGCIAQAKALIERISLAIEYLIGAVRRFSGEEMSDKLAACLILKGADTSDVERFLLMCEANDALELLWQELKEEVNDGR